MQRPQAVRWQATVLMKCELEFVKLREVLLGIEDKRAATIVEALVASLPE